MLFLDGIPPNLDFLLPHEGGPMLFLDGTPPNLNFLLPHEGGSWDGCFSAYDIPVLLSKSNLFSGVVLPCKVLNIGQCRCITISYPF